MVLVGELLLQEAISNVVLQLPKVLGEFDPTIHRVLPFVAETYVVVRPVYGTRGNLFVFISTVAEDPTAFVRLLRCREMPRMEISWCFTPSGWVGPKRIILGKIVIPPGNGT